MVNNYPQYPLSQSADILGHRRHMLMRYLRFTAACLIGLAIGYVYMMIPDQPQTRLHPPCVGAMWTCQVAVGSSTGGG
jgi:hypothetical protein